MKRFVLLLCLLSGATHAASWSDLWVTHDDRRRAYEEIQSGEYASAAKRLEHFKDPQSQYNRGNAFAREGKLENALAAYDNAIKQTPADSELGRDARHNRDLVADQLKKQRQSQQQQQQQQQQQGQQGQRGQEGQQDKQGQQSQPQAKQPQQPKSSEQSKDEKGDQNGKPAAAALDQPPSEQSLALEQWLRQIPDDPSGLLRRKFWIEHLRREQEGRP